MSRFIAADLAALGDVPAVQTIDFEQIAAGRSAFLIEALAQRGIDYDVTGLQTDPLVIAYSQGGGYREMLYRQLLNEAIRAVMSATAIGGDLDHIAATFTGIARLEFDNEPDDEPPAAQWDDVKGKWVERDDIFRARLRLAFEAFSTAGPEGAYVFHALQLDGVHDIADAVAYSEEDGATYSDGMHADAYTAGIRSEPFEGREDGDPVLAPEALVVVLPSLAYGSADQSLLDRTFAAVNADQMRPLGDNVRIEPASVTQYSIEVTLHYAPGADPFEIKAEAARRLEAYATARRRIGVVVQRKVIAGRAAVDNGVTVTVAQPPASIDPGPKGAAECSDITVHVVQEPGSWD